MAMSGGKSCAAEFTLFEVDLRLSVAPKCPERAFGSGDRTCFHRKSGPPVTALAIALLRRRNVWHVRMNGLTQRRVDPGRITRGAVFPSASAWLSAVFQGVFLSFSYAAHMDRFRRFSS